MKLYHGQTKYDVSFITVFVTVKTIIVITPKNHDSTMVQLWFDHMVQPWYSGYQKASYSCQFNSQRCKNRYLLEFQQTKQKNPV